LSTSRNSTEKYKPAEVKSFFRVRNSLTKINMMSFALRSLALCRRRLPLSPNVCFARFSCFDFRLFVFIQKLSIRWMTRNLRLRPLILPSPAPPHTHRQRCDKRDMLWNKTLQLGRTIRRLTSFLACDKKLLERGKGHNLCFLLYLSQLRCEVFVRISCHCQSLNSRLSLRRCATRFQEVEETMRRRLRAGRRDKPRAMTW
jgi:hypothetical protein